ncbi:hypothetical protein BUALT_Bualt02G0121700 [Buddleja alternifolia]|uniref:Uncharacterized protein n=1 Tax=Buddleja alternifolia TaxID=168488 RepID=A0AAV6Y149_9LAMI|nr:hypothetical protein BUALT_Bualt02G0121700 [Buddleja alternifolia]
MGHHSCCNKQKVKRGLWSPEEDEKLISYISTYGHGCWSSVPRLAGLQRCGKSCRLRWINYLRPDLKRGSFTHQEATLIIELHRILGNRLDQVMMMNNYHANSIIPSSSSSLSNYPPFGYNNPHQILDQTQTHQILKQDDNFVFGFDNPINPVLDNSLLISSKPKIHQDSSSLVVDPHPIMLPRLNEISTTQDHVLEEIDARDMLEYLMASFGSSSSTTPPPSSASSSSSPLPPPPCNGGFVVNPSFSSSWGPQP